MKIILFIVLNKMAASVYFLLLLLLALLSYCEGATRDDDFQFIKVAKADRYRTVRLTFAIKQTNKDWLRKKIETVSNPESPDYGKYLNFDEIAKVVHGEVDAVGALVNCFADFGVTLANHHFTLGRDFAVVDVPVGVAERLFSADYYVFKEPVTGIETVRSHTYSLPHSLRGHIDYVVGVTDFPRPNRIFATHSTIPLRKRSGGDVTPQLLYKDYKIGNYTSKSGKNSQAIASFLKQYFSPSDLKAFQKGYHLQQEAVAKVVGENDPQDPGMEANLDVQFIMSTARNAPTWFVSTSKLANHGQEDFLSWIIGQVNTTDSPWVHSASYGDVESSIPSDYLSRVEIEFQKFGLSGRTLFFASGDSGVDCKGIFHHEYTPMWPSSSPFVTAVGGTVSLHEVWRDGGGGFSNVFPTPSYQSDAVKEYLGSGKAPPVKYFNSSGRAYPDVSVYSVACDIVIDGLPWPVDGTSCASPIFAGIASLLNDVRLLQGKPTLGLLNPLLYGTLKGKGFFDITTGSNPGPLGLCGGFEATVGWDPASGWGSPNFSILKDLV